MKKPILNFGPLKDNPPGIRIDLEIIELPPSTIPRKELRRLIRKTVRAKLPEFEEKLLERWENHVREMLN